MIFQSQQNELQNGYYTQMAHDLLKVRAISNNKLVFRHVNTGYNDHSTQLLNELGTTDTAIGDATAEIMITTLGKIPNEMYYLEDTTPSGKITVYGTESQTTLDNNHTTLALFDIAKSDGYGGCSTLLVALLMILFIILLLCCVTACMIASSRRKHIFFNRSDIECSPTCSGVKQPLLGPDKISDTTRTSNNSANN